MSKYFVVNVSRRPKTRAIRNAAPAPERFMQKLCGGQIRVPRKRHQQLPEELLERFWDELKAKWEGGAIEVHEDSPMGPLFLFDNVAAEVKEMDENIETVLPEEPEKEEEKGLENDLGQPDDTWTKAQISEWLLEHGDLEDADSEDLMKLKKSELLELV